MLCPRTVLLCRCCSELRSPELRRRAELWLRTELLRPEVLQATLPSSLPPLLQAQVLQAGVLRAQVLQGQVLQGEVLQAALPPRLPLDLLCLGL